MTTRWPSRLVAVVMACAIAGSAIAGCSSEDDGVSPAIVAMPTAVPASADLIESERAIGAREPGQDERRLGDMSCSDGLMIVATTRETIYAELPCDRFATPEIIDRFRDVALRVTVRPAGGEGPAEGGGKLIIESETRASLEFTIGHAWIDGD